MNTGRLAEIEEWAHDVLSIASIPRARDVLALVEVAKAALEAEDLWRQRMMLASTVMPDRDDPNPLVRAYYRLMDALARLDSGATEGDA